MQDRNLKALISKIIIFYSIFYVIMKLIAISFQDAWLVPNLILCIPYILFGVIGWIMLKKGKFSWIYVAAGVIVISAVRYYEKEWMLALYNYFSA